MATPAHNIRAQLVDRRERLEGLIGKGPPAPELDRLLVEVEHALERFAVGTYGVCETCGDPIEAVQLEADPLSRFCLDHLSPSQAHALQQDLDLAGRVQRTLLPPGQVVAAGWEMAYRYEPLGAVSGDYCDIVLPLGPDGGLYFLLGDISGKGVAASMLMAHLHASVRTLLSLELPLSQVVARANRVFCDSTMSNHYATLVCARLSTNGEVELCNAGHCPPLLVHGSDVTPIEATGVPVGLFCVNDYPARRLTLAPGDALVLYTDGVTEARNRTDEEYGEARLASLVAGLSDRSSEAVVAACVQAVSIFRGGRTATDDLTVMVVRRVAAN
ncbi:MAG TPA: SpoIIE family protein phosphatase [Vicinamibacterales bacterium]|jgi:sigma-B regulation protein RsbU (phosphoserine phosphatase)